MRYIYGDRYTQADRLWRDRAADHADALHYDDPLMYLWTLGYDVSEARIVES